VTSATPDIFPKSHNQVAAKSARDRFGTVSALASNPELQQAHLCSLSGNSGATAPAWDECSDDDRRCGAWASIGQCNQTVVAAACPKSCGLCSFCFLKKCDVGQNAERERSAPGMCNCYCDGSALPQPVQDGHVLIEATVVGLDMESWWDIQPNLTAHFEDMLDMLTAPPFGMVQTRNYTAPVPRKQPPLYQEHWRSGRFGIWPSFAVPTLTVFTHRLGTNPSEVTLSTPNTTLLKPFCYCDGAETCAESIGFGPSTFNYTLPASARALRARAPDALSQASCASARSMGRRGRNRRRLEEVGALATAAFAAPSAAARRLAEVRLTSAMRTVNVIWGILVEEPSFLDAFSGAREVEDWFFDSMFEPADPWVQRAMLRMTSDLPAELRASQEDPGGTWLQIFEGWLNQRGKQYPARDFHGSVAEFLKDSEPHHKNLLFAGSKVKAVRVAFTLNVPSPMLMSEAQDLKQAWDKHVEVRNQEAALRAKHAWHTSPAWVSVAAHGAIVVSSWLAAILTFAVGISVVAYLTRDKVLTLLTVVSVATTIFMQVFFTSVIAGWQTGAIDAIALLVFMGYLFTVSVRVTMAYGSAIVDESSFQAHAYSLRPEDGMDDPVRACRYQRIQHALDIEGTRIVTSAVLVLGTCAWPIFGTLQFHLRFGFLALVTSVLLLAQPLVFLPALLLLVGPAKEEEPSPFSWWNWLMELLQHFLDFYASLDAPEEEATPQYADDPDIDGDDSPVALSLPKRRGGDSNEPGFGDASEAGTAGDILYLKGAHKPAHKILHNGNEDLALEGDENLDADTRVDTESV